MNSVPIALLGFASIVGCSTTARRVVVSPIPSFVPGRAMDRISGEVAEVIAVKGTLSDDDLAKAKAYLPAKFNL